MVSSGARGPLADSRLWSAGAALPRCRLHWPTEAMGGAVRLGCQSRRTALPPASLAHGGDGGAVRLGLPVAGVVCSSRPRTRAWLGCPPPWGRWGRGWVGLLTGFAFVSGR